MSFIYAVTEPGVKIAPPIEKWKDASDCASPHYAVLTAVRNEIEVDRSDRKIDVWTAPTDSIRYPSGLPRIVLIHSVVIGDCNKPDKTKTENTI